jgi:hypothetical protein
VAIRDTTREKLEMMLEELSVFDEEACIDVDSVEEEGRKHCRTSPVPVVGSIYHGT